MPEQFLDGPQVCAVAEQVRGVGMAQGVRVQAGVGGEAHGVLLDDAFDSAHGEAGSGAPEEQGSGPMPGAGAEVALERLGGFGAERNLALLAALAADPEPLAIAVEVFQVEAGQFADAESAAV